MVGIIKLGTKLVLMKPKGTLAILVAHHTEASFWIQCHFKPLSPFFKAIAATKPYDVDFMAEWYSIVHEDHNFFIHFSLSKDI